MEEKSVEIINQNEMKNKNEQTEDLSHNILSIPEKCRRCHYNSVEIMCKQCYPFIYFCSNCSQNLHSMESKQNHQIINLKELNPNLFDEFNNIDKKYILNEFNEDNNNIDEKTKNYINDIKSLYLTEKNNFFWKSLNLEKSFEKLKNSYIEKINDLTEHLKNFENNKNGEIKILLQEKNSEFENILANQNSKINFLLQKNEELNKYNKNLLSQISENNIKINEMKKLNLNLKQIINQQKSEIELLNKEKNDMKEKMERINNLFIEEKKEMIKKYEEQIQKINRDYMEQKDKMKFILLQRETEINDIKNKFDNEINELKKELEGYKHNYKNINNNYSELNNIINKQQSEIEDLKYQLNNGEIKYINECEDKKILKNKLEEYKLSFEKLKNKNEYLNKIIYGNSKKE